MVSVNLKKIKNKTKSIKPKMSKNKKQPGYISLFSKHGFAAFAFIVAVVFGLSSFSLVKADEFEAKINKLQQQNNKKEVVYDQLGSEANSIRGTINKLQEEIDAKQAAINKYQTEVENLKKEIAAAQKELDKQKRILGEMIKTMYVEGDITTLEMLATSKNLSDFFDKQQYRESVRTKVKETLDKITQLKLDLNTKKQKTEKLLSEQRTLKSELVKQQSKKNNLLSLKESQRAAVEDDIARNNKRIASLRRQQAIANLQLSGGAGVVAGDPSHGGYPSRWANAPQDSMLDSWGMYNRECVSYTAWKVYQRFGFMPYWGGHGNANEWPGNARAAGIPTSSTPKRNSVAIWNVGYYGHAMWVEAVNGDGSIWVSQYNYDYNGHYSEMLVSASMANNLTYIYFK